uniref:WD repeat-containing protein 91 n=1 Tax=Poecilia reticulata TaxID=8081 RepID=A0A3P9PE05_POERE
MGSAVERTDKHVREYLLYRGFTSTLKQLDSDIKADKEKGFRVDRIIEQLQQLVQSFDLAGLKEYWLYLDRRLFCRLEDVYRSTVNKLRTSLYRYYVINTVQKGNLEKTQEFFQKQALELQAQAEWRDWFMLPFIPTPDQNPAFGPYFSRQWADTFLVSLHNFLSVLFQSPPQPVLLSFDAEVQRMTSLAEENEQLRQVLFALQTESRDQRDGDEAAAAAQHKLPPYVQNMDRLGDAELDLVTSLRVVSAAAAATPSRNFFSTLLPQAKRAPVKAPPAASGSPNQGALGRKELPASQVKAGVSSGDSRCFISQSGDGRGFISQSGDSRCFISQSGDGRCFISQSAPAQLYVSPPQAAESRADDVDAAAAASGAVEPPDSSGLQAEQPFIKLSQEEYGEHHSSIMHCRYRAAAGPLGAGLPVWSFNPMMQTKATIMSKSPLLSLEWATKPDRLLLLGSGVGTVRLYDTDAKKNLYEMNIDETHPRILSLACSPSGSSFVCSAAALSRSGSVDSAPRLPIPVSGQLLLWDTKTVKQQLRFSLEPEPVAINCTAFNHNGNLLVTGAADGVIRLFVHPVEHPPLRREAVGAGPASGRHRPLRPVGLQRLQTGEDPGTLAVLLAD